MADSTQSAELRVEVSKWAFVEYGVSYDIPAPEKLRARAISKSQRFMGDLRRHFEACELRYELLATADGTYQKLCVVAVAPRETAKLLAADELPDFWGILMSICSHIMDYRVEEK